MNKLFFFDIDGTLIDCHSGDYSISSEVVNALDQLKQQGHDIFLATGRCKCFILDEVMAYPFSGYVTCNGAHVEYKNEIVYKKVIPAKAIQKTHDLCVKRKMAYYFENSECIYVLDKNNPRHIEFKTVWGMKDKIIEDQFNIEDIETYIGMIVANDEKDIPFIQRELSEYFDVQRHLDGLSFDLTLKGESKAKGILELTKILHNKVENTIAFGDGRNDIEMLSQVGLGIAMGNAANEAKEAADYVTTEIHDHGIVNALNHFSFL